MNKLDKWEIKDIINSLHRRDDFSIVEKLAKYVEKLSEHVNYLEQENIELKSEIKNLKQSQEKGDRNLSNKIDAVSHKVTYK